MAIMNRKLDDLIDDICQKDSRYKRDAYEFVMDALAYTQRKYNRLKHVTGVELLEGVKELLLNKFGPMTLSVLHYWGIQQTDDFGNIVFNLVENKILSKSEDDDIKQFRNRYDFVEVFDRGYRQQLEKRISRMRSFK